MKRAILILTVFCILFSMAACSSDSSASLPAAATVKNVEESAQAIESAAISETAPSQTEKTTVQTEKPSIQTVMSEKQTVNADKSPSIVKITIPASLFEGKSKDQVIEYAKEYGITDITENDDGSYTFTMTKAQHEELLKDVKESLISTIDDVSGSGNYPSINSISYNDSFTEITVLADQTTFENSFAGIAIMGIAQIDMYYHLLNGVKLEDIKIIFSIKNAETYEVFKTVTYPETV